MLLKYLFCLCLLKLALATSGVAPLVQLRDGHKMPQLGLGTWLGTTNEGTRVKPEGTEVQKAVEWAIDAGYRHIDTAHIYDTETQVGRGVANKIADGTVTRDQLFITTKLWNDKHAKDDVVPALRESLSKLGMEYLDLYLIHWPIGQYNNGTFDNTDYVETWKGMVEAKKLGLTKSIGLSNFNQRQIDRILKTTDEAPAVLQVEINLNLQQPSLLSYCKQHNISVTGYTPFGSLFHSKAKPDAPAPRVDDPVLVAISHKYNKTVPQVNLRYLMELGITPLPKSVSKSRIEQNIDVFNFTLTEEEKSTMRTFDMGYRTIPQIKWIQHIYYPFGNNTQ